MAENKPLPPFARGDFVARHWVGKPMTELRLATIRANLLRLF